MSTVAVTLISIAVVIIVGIPVIILLITLLSACDIDSSELLNGVSFEDGHDFDVWRCDEEPENKQQDVIF